MYKIALSEPEIGEEEISAVVDVLKSKWLVAGSVTESFERAFAEKLGVKYAFAVSNCTAALHIACLSLDLSSKDEVICPALTFVATANAIRYTGAKVVLADVVSVHDLTIDPQDIEQKITEKTRAIMVMHYAGFPCAMANILAVAKKYNLFIIEDCAHAPFVELPGFGFLGSIGDVGCFSFFGNKNMTTGEGGMIVTNRDDLAEKMRLFRSHGMTAVSYDKKTGHAFDYDVKLLGYNYRTDDIHSAIGLQQLKKIDTINAKRRELTKLYRSCLCDNPDIVIPFLHQDTNGSSCHIFSIVTKHKERIRNRLFSAGVQTSRHYKMLYRFSSYCDQMFFSRVDDNCLLTLPLYPSLLPEQVKYIASFL